MEWRWCKREAEGALYTFSFLPKLVRPTSARKWPAGGLGYVAHVTKFVVYNSSLTFPYGAKRGIKLNQVSPASALCPPEASQHGAGVAYHSKASLLPITPPSSFLGKHWLACSVSLSNSRVRSYSPALILSLDHTQVPERRSLSFKVELPVYKLRRVEEIRGRLA